MVKEKRRGKNFFQVREMSGNFYGWSGILKNKLKTQGKFRNLEIHGNCSLQKVHLFCLEQRMFFLENIVQTHLSPQWELLLKDRVCFLEGTNFFFVTVTFPHHFQVYMLHCRSKE